MRAGSVMVPNWQSAGRVVAARVRRTPCACSAGEVPAARRSAAAGAVAPGASLRACRPRSARVARRWHTAFRWPGPASRSSPPSRPPPPARLGVRAAAAASARRLRSQRVAWTRARSRQASGDFVESAAASSAGNVWAFTFKGQVLRYNGTQLGQGEEVRASRSARAPCSAAPTSGSSGHRAPARITTTATPGPGRPRAAGWTAASALSASSIWAYGGTKVAHWNGSTWTKTSAGQPAAQEHAAEPLAPGRHLRCLGQQRLRRRIRRPPGRGRPAGAAALQRPRRGARWPSNEPRRPRRDHPRRQRRPVDPGAHRLPRRREHGALRGRQAEQRQAAVLARAPAAVRGCDGDGTTAALAVGYSRTSFNAKTYDRRHPPLRHLTAAAGSIRRGPGE